MRIVTLVLSLLGAYLVVLDGFRLLLVGTMAQAVGPTAGDAALRAGHTAQGLGALLALGGVVALVAPRLAVGLFVLLAGFAFWTAAATGSTQAVAWGAGAALLAVTAALGPRSGPGGTRGTRAPRRDSRTTPAPAPFRRSAAAAPPAAQASRRAASTAGCRTRKPPRPGRARDTTSGRTRTEAQPAALSSFVRP